MWLLRISKKESPDMETCLSQSTCVWTPATTCSMMSLRSSFLSIPTAAPRKAQSQTQMGSVSRVMSRSETANSVLETILVSPVCLKEQNSRYSTYTILWLLTASICAEKAVWKYTTMTMNHAKIALAILTSDLAHPTAIQVILSEYAALPTGINWTLTE